MDKQTQYIGKTIHNLTDLASEYQKIAAEDEEAGRLLLENGKYRHAAYFFVQAMEKHVRYKIFSLVNPNTEYFRDRVRTHNLEQLLDFLIEIVSSKPNVQEQVKTQLEENVLGGVKFGQLHNDLRYPFYEERREAYAFKTIQQKDAELTLEKLQGLKAFLQDIDRLRRGTA